MRSHLGSVLRLVRHHPPPDAPVLEAPEAQRALTDVEFSAFAEECRIFGRVQLDAERLSDMLNHVERLVLADVLVTRLVDGQTYEVDEITVERDDLMVVDAFGPRGNQNRRLRARPHLLAVKLGPYEVRGYVHVTPGADVLNAIQRRRPMIPLTEASILYSSGGVPIRHRAGTLIFNRECADWLALTDDEEIEFPELPVPASNGPMVKDFTGQLLTFRDG